jgi:hypothetical protein
MGNSHKNLFFRKHWANCNQALVEWSLNSPLPKIFPVIPTSSQDVRQAWFYVKLISAVGSILVEGPYRRTHFWKRTIQWVFHQNLDLIEQMVSDKKIKRRLNLEKSSLKLLSQSQPNFAEIILGWSPSKIMPVISDPRRRWSPHPNLI